MVVARLHALDEKLHLAKTKGPAASEIVLPGAVLSEEAEIREYLRQELDAIVNGTTDIVENAQTYSSHKSVGGVAKSASIPPKKGGGSAAAANDAGWGSTSKSGINPFKSIGSRTLESVETKEKNQQVENQVKSIGSTAPFKSIGSRTGSQPSTAPFKSTGSRAEETKDTHQQIALHVAEAEKSAEQDLEDYNTPACLA